MAGAAEPAGGRGGRRRWPAAACRVDFVAGTALARGSWSAVFVAGAVHRGCRRTGRTCGRYWPAAACRVDFVSRGRRSTQRLQEDRADTWSPLARGGLPCRFRCRHTVGVQILWQAQYTEVPGGPGGRVVAAGPRLLAVQISWQAQRLVSLKCRFRGRRSTQSLQEDGGWPAAACRVDFVAGTALGAGGVPLSMPYAVDPMEAMLACKKSIWCIGWTPLTRNRKGTPLQRNRKGHTTHRTPLILHHSAHTTHHTLLILHHSSHTTHHTPHSSHTTHHTSLISLTFIVQYLSVLFSSQSLLLVASSDKLNMWGYPVLS